MRRAALLALAALPASCSGEKAADEVRVFAASSLTEVMQTIAADFEKETGVTVKLNLAASSTLAKQIVEGAPCDVFLSADQEWADYVEKADLVEPGTRRDLLRNNLVVVLRLIPGEFNLGVFGGDMEEKVDPLKRRERHEKDARSALLDKRVERLAMGDAAHVPAGKYGRHALEALGLWEALSPKVVPCDSARATLGLVERGEADAGIVYASDARSSKAVELVVDRFGDPVILRGPDIRYPAMRLRDAGGKAPRFDMYLDSLAARRVFEAAGFGIAEKTE